MIHSATGCFQEKYGEKYLVLDSTENYDEVFSGIKKENFMKIIMLELE